jgi:hypothetical protein
MNIRETDGAIKNGQSRETGKRVFYFIHYGILSDIVPPEFCCKKCGKT